VGNSGGLGVAIVLRDSNRTILDSQGVVDSSIADISYTATSSGTAYLDVSASVNSTSKVGNYLAFANDYGVDTTLDTPLTNASLTIGFGLSTYGNINSLPESGSFNTSSDHDWLAVSLTAGHDYIFSAQAISGTLNDVAIALRDSNRTILDSQGVVDAGAYATSSFVYSATSSGVAYLDVSAGGSDAASLLGIYQINVIDSDDTVLDTASSTASLIAAGGTFGEIDAVPMSGSFDSSLDHDWFAVNLIAGHDYRFSALAASGTLNDLAIDLRDSSRAILNSQGVVDTGINGPFFTYTATSSGTAYLDISAGGNNPASQTGQYVITYVDQGADTALDTASTVASLPIGITPTSGQIDGVPESGSFNSSLDHDWFAVNLIADHIYTFSAQGTFRQSERCCNRPPGFQPHNSRSRGRS
jgi:hypothetical protein